MSTSPLFVFLRDTALGQLIRLASGKRVLRYAEECEEFVVPEQYTSKAAAEGANVLVDWYAEDDVENPQNWPFWAKRTVMATLFIVTLAVYGGSSIITLGFASLMRDFGVSLQYATLTLSIYVLGYGVGAMVWSPLSEVPALGRNMFYWPAIGAFLPLQAGAALTSNFHALVALRFLTGFLGAPTLATAGASLQDVYTPTCLPVAFSLWALAAFFGPSIGPLVAGFAVEAHDWRWTMWELLWLIGASEVLLLVALPETSPATILHRRAARLRARTGNANIRSYGEVEQAHKPFLLVVRQSVLRPFVILLRDPQIAFSDAYISLLYATYYLFFAAFPVWQEQLGWQIGVQGVSYIVIAIGGSIGTVAYVAYQFIAVPRFVKRHGIPSPEKRLEPALPFALLSPIGLFIFAATARRDVPWIAALVGIATVTCSNFVIFQCIFLYIAMAYPKYAASILAGNDFVRSLTATAILHGGEPLYRNLGITGGSSLLAGLSLAFVVPLVLIHRYGKQLRARSRFAE